MSRRHNASRRRSYTRRQHEVRERRPDGEAGESWTPLNDSDNWQTDDDFSFDAATPPTRGRLSGAHP